VPVPAVQGAVPTAPAVPAGPPTVGEQRQQPLAVPPGVSEQREAAPSGTESQRYPAPASQPLPRVPEGSTFRAAPVYPPSVRLDRIVSASSTNLQGEIVSEDSKPIANVQLLFVPTDKDNTRESATADAAGKFQVALEPGTWLVYTVSSDGKSDFRRKIEVGANQPGEVRLVSR
jgi:hypothetical protein